LHNRYAVMMTTNLSTPGCVDLIAPALRRAECRTPVTEVCRAIGVSEQTYCRWNERYGMLILVIEDPPWNIAPCAVLNAQLGRGEITGQCRRCRFRLRKYTQRPQGNLARADFH
jgi:hypothetical protein